LASLIADSVGSPRGDLATNPDIIASGISEGTIVDWMIKIAIGASRMALTVFPVEVVAVGQLSSRNRKD
jgi:hypothetical protein